MTSLQVVLGSSVYSHDKPYSLGVEGPQVDTMRGHRLLDANLGPFRPFWAIESGWLRQYWKGPLFSVLSAGFWAGFWVGFLAGFLAGFWAGFFFY